MSSHISTPLPTFEPVIQFSNFVKSYNGRPVISIANLSLNSGMYWLKGENGAGKSTMMRSIAGLVPYDGKISINDITISQNRISYCQMVRYAEAEPVFPTFLTGLELMRFYLDCGVGTRAAMDRYAALFGVDAFASGATGTYSSGMLKKLALVLCLAAESPVLLLDEPLITLDVATCEKLLIALHELAASGKTIILTSHQDVAIPGLEATVLTISNGTLI